MNKRNRKRLLYGMAGVIVAAGVTYACKDFLNVPAQGTVDESALATRSGVEGTLVATYRALDCDAVSVGSWGCAASNWTWGDVGSGDSYTGSEPGDQQAVNDLEAYFWSVGTVDTYLDQKWSQVYDGVARANATIRLLDKVCPQKPCAEISDADIDGIRGEAIFLRAHYHFEAYRMWGNIPYYRANDADFKKTNVGVDATAEILVDLDSAIALLPATPRNGDKGRVTSWTARAYKGRVQVYAKDFSGALTTLRAVQLSNVYSLETSIDHVWTGLAQYRNGPETILAFQASAKDGEPAGWNSNWGERLNFPHSGSRFGCCGFHQPTQNLVNFFAVDAAGLPLELSNPAWNALDTSFAGGIMTPVDPRLDWTVGRDNVPYKDWGLHKPGWIRNRPYSGPYSPKKNVHEQASDAEGNAGQGWTNTQTNSVPIHIFRYADMLLLLAEAEVEAGVLENARTIVNQIRARAGQTAQGCGVAAGNQYPTEVLYPTCAGNTSMTAPLTVSGTVYSLSEPWAEYRIGLYPGPWTDQAFARRAVKYERRLELAMEGQRLFDLRRWGDADTTIANYIAVEKNRRTYLSASATYGPKYALYPIPTLQIDLSKVGAEDRLVQNPGW